LNRDASGGLLSLFASVNFDVNPDLALRFASGRAGAWVLHGVLPGLKGWVGSGIPYFDRVRRGRRLTFGGGLR
jgi:hypothetical protein